MSTFLRDSGAVSPQNPPSNFVQVQSSEVDRLSGFLDKMGNGSLFGVIIRQVTYIKQKLASALHTGFNI